MRNAVVVCKLSSEDEHVNFSQADRHQMLGYCTAALSEARQREDLILHVVTSWPPRGHFIPSCTARRDESIYCIDGPSLLKNEGFIEMLLQTQIRQIILIGAIDIEIYRDLAARAATQNLNVKHDMLSLVICHAT